MDNHAQPEITMTAVQTQEYERIVSLLSEHFEHFALVVVPGGAGEPLQAPKWAWSYDGNHCMLAGALECAKSEIVAAAPRAPKSGAK